MGASYSSLVYNIPVVTPALAESSQHYSLLLLAQDRPPICLDGNTRAYLARYRAPPLFILIPFSTFALSASISDNGDDPFNTIPITNEPISFSIRLVHNECVWQLIFLGTNAISR
ncbi:hypothetical protein M422DRAFT_261369 [Sphaerobolus stellatus SS14]|uniref:Uncharacterized protein n=1 Tax=Sphaerobolus stellatus (strain SS14) TaxID=990650 RepID=A0A0C9UN01_SPHS4|nr:hypothetical protein M422DRAFT_261369 [Sphaerobolus stellatus SS14]